MKIKRSKISLVFILIAFGVFFTPYISYSQVIRSDSSTKSKNVFIEFNKNKSNGFRKSRVSTDTLTTSKITRIWETNGLVHIEVTLQKKGVEITLKAYNMLGKEIKTIYNGTQSKDKEEYQFNSSEFPNGIYICMLVGPTFRDTEKFIISR